MKYIGIRGHRGAGKTTVAYLLGNTLNYLTQHNHEDEYESLFRIWCNNIRENPRVVDNCDLTWVIFEEFGDSPKMLINMLTGIGFHDMNSPYYKDHMVINMRNFDKNVIEDLSQFEGHLYTAEEYFLSLNPTIQPEAIKEDIFMTLREFILYFGIYIMQNAFGLNVWIKSMSANSHYFEGLFPDDNKGYKIFSDIKARSEVSFIYDKGGVVVRVQRPGHIKSGGMNLLRGDNRYDYEVVIDGEMEALAPRILEIATDIINKQKEENGSISC